jgi:hypothetical protein
MAEARIAVHAVDGYVAVSWFILLKLMTIN